jgi:hypothetical protein
MRVNRERTEMQKEDAECTLLLVSEEVHTSRRSEGSHISMNCLGSY